MLNRKPIRWTAALTLILVSALFFAAWGRMAARPDSTKPDSAKPVVIKLEPQTTCPIMGENINKKVFVDYQGKRIYFCCKMCPPEFNKDPEKYIKKLEAMGQGVETLSAPKVKQEKKNTEKPDTSMKGMKM